MNDIKLFLTDVDGCLTDGGMYYSETGDELKRFCVYDGMGMALLRKFGIKCGILTSEITDIVVKRARKLHLDYLYMGAGRQMDQSSVLRYAPADTAPVSLPFHSKLDAAKEICAEMGISLSEVAYVGDDINDIDLLKEVGFPACPANAVDKVKLIEGIHILSRHGGNGAVRELAELILSTKKKV